MSRVWLGGVMALSVELLMAIISSGSWCHGLSMFLRDGPHRIFSHILDGDNQDDA